MHLTFDTGTQEDYGPRRADAFTRREHASIMSRTVLPTTFLVALALWTGAGIFFSAVVLPTLFINLETVAAGQTAALLFPGYYAFGIGAGAVATLAAVALARGGSTAWRYVIAALALAWACHLYAGLSIRPRMATLRGQEAGVVEFQRLHRLSVRLNGVVRVATLGVLVASAGLLERRRD